MSILTMAGFLEAKPKVGYYISSGKSTLINESFLMKSVMEFKSVPSVVGEKTSVYDASVAMFLENTGSIYVAENNCLKGIVSRKDLLKAVIGGGNNLEMPVTVVMTRLPKIIYCLEDEPVIDAVKKIVFNEIDSVPIVEIGDEGEYKILGKFSKTNISESLLEMIGSNEEGI